MELAIRTWETQYPAQAHSQQLGDCPFLHLKTQMCGQEEGNPSHSFSQGVGNSRGHCSTSDSPFPSSSFFTPSRERKANEAASNSPGMGSSDPGQLCKRSDSCTLPGPPEPKVGPSYRHQHTNALHLFYPITALFPTGTPKVACRSQGAEPSNQQCMPCTLAFKSPSTARMTLVHTTTTGLKL